jgi:hypothetical protein
VLRSIASEFRGVARNAYNSMDASVVADSTQHTTICPRCRAQRPLSQAQVEIGRAPICDGCGGTMIVQVGCRRIALCEGPRAPVLMLESLAELVGEMAGARRSMVQFPFGWVSSKRKMSRPPS